MINNFNEIPEERKLLLNRLINYIQEKRKQNLPIQLVYICTHNSRRSHFGQIWAAVAANYYRIKNIKTFSGGTEATAFNINAINTLKKIGFEISQNDVQTSNPKYIVQYGTDKKEHCVCFSKVYNDVANPKSNFSAIMTCSDAEQNCPFISGAELCIGTTYNDPKEFDNTPYQDEKYLERLRQIALECLFVFSNIK